MKKWMAVVMLVLLAGVIGGGLTGCATTREPQKTGTGDDCTWTCPVCQTGFVTEMECREHMKDCCP